MPPKIPCYPVGWNALRLPNLVRATLADVEGGEAKSAPPDAVADAEDGEYGLSQYRVEDNPLIWQHLIKAEIGKAEILEQQGKIEAASDVYGDTIFMMGTYPWTNGYHSLLAENPKLFQELRVKALLKRGALLEKHGKFGRVAINYESLGEAIAGDDNLATRQTVFAALLKWVESTSQSEDKDKEIRAYNLLFKFFGHDETPMIREQLIGITIRRGDKNPSLQFINFGSFARDKNPSIREQIASALLRWAQTAGQQGDTDSEIEFYTAIYSYYSDDREPAIRARVDQALRHLLEKISQPDAEGYIDEAYVVEIRALLEARGKAPVEAPEAVADAADTDLAAAGKGGTESLSLLSPEAANQKLKPILISLFVANMDDKIEIYDEIVRRFGDDANPAVQKQIGRALLHKARVLNHQEDKEKIAEAIPLYDEVVQRFGNEMDVTGALGNVAEAALIVGRNEEAIARAKVLQKHPDADKQDKAIMAFIIWLADPKTPLQEVQKAIQAAGNEEFHWSFKEVQPVIDSLPKTRGKQAKCFIEYFTQYLNEKGLRVCLKK